MSNNIKEWVKRHTLLIKRIGECRHGVPSRFRCSHCISDAYAHGRVGAEGFEGITPRVNEWVTTKTKVFRCQDASFAYMSKAERDCDNLITIPVGSYIEDTFICSKCLNKWILCTIHGGYPDFVTDYKGSPNQIGMRIDLKKLRAKNHGLYKR